MENRFTENDPLIDDLMKACAECLDRHAVPVKLWPETLALLAANAQLTIRRAERIGIRLTKEGLFSAITIKS